MYLFIYNRSQKRRGDGTDKSTGTLKTSSFKPCPPSIVTGSEDVNYDIVIHQTGASPSSSPPPLLPPILVALIVWLSSTSWSEERDDNHLVWFTSVLPYQSNKPRMLIRRSRGSTSRVAMEKRKKKKCRCCRACTRKLRGSFWPSMCSYCN